MDFTITESKKRKLGKFRNKGLSYNAEKDYINDISKQQFPYNPRKHIKFKFRFRYKDFQLTEA
jgi:hypothetical protein